MAVYPEGYALVRWRFKATGDPEEMLCTWGIRHIAAAEDGQTLADDLATAYSVAIPGSLMVNTYTFVGVTVTLGPQPGTGPTFESVTNVAGTVNAPPPPSNSAVLVKKLTALGGRKFRGRFYMPPCLLDEGDVDQNGTISPANVTAIQNNVDDWVGEVLAIETISAIALLHNVAGITGIPTDILNHVVETKLATQRRRMRR